MEENGTLYCYRLDEMSGVLSRYEIPSEEWTLHKHKWNTERDEYVFYADLGTGSYYKYGVQRRKLDKFVATKLYTFNPSKLHAVTIVAEMLGSKLAKAQKELNRYTKVLNMFEKQNIVGSDKGETN